MTYETYFLNRLVLAILSFSLICDSTSIYAAKTTTTISKASTQVKLTTTTAKPTVSRTTAKASTTTTTTKAPTTTTAKASSANTATAKPAILTTTTTAKAAVSTTTTASSINNIAYAQNNADARIALFNISTQYATASTVVSNVTNILAETESIAADRISTTPATLGAVSGYTAFATTCGVTNTDSFTPLNNGSYQYRITSSTALNSILTDAPSSLAISSGIVTLKNFTSGSTDAKVMKITGTLEAGKYGDINIADGSAITIVIKEAVGTVCSISIGTLNPSGDKTLNLSDTVLCLEKKTASTSFSHALKGTGKVTFGTSYLANMAIDIYALCDTKKNSFLSFFGVFQKDQKIDLGSGFGAILGITSKEVSNAVFVLRKVTDAQSWNAYNAGICGTSVSDEDYCFAAYKDGSSVSITPGSDGKIYLVKFLKNPNWTATFSPIDGLGELKFTNLVYSKQMVGGDETRLSCKVNDTIDATFYADNVLSILGLLKGANSGGLTGGLKGLIGSQLALGLQLSLTKDAMSKILGMDITSMAPVSSLPLSNLSLFLVYAPDKQGESANKGLHFTQQNPSVDVYLPTGISVLAQVGLSSPVLKPVVDLFGLNTNEYSALTTILSVTKNSVDAQILLPITTDIGDFTLNGISIGLSASTKGLSVGLDAFGSAILPGSLTASVFDLQAEFKAAPPAVKFSGTMLGNWKNAFGLSNFDINALALEIGVNIPPTPATLTVGFATDMKIGDKILKLAGKYSPEGDIVGYVKYTGDLGTNDILGFAGLPKDINNTIPAIIVEKPEVKIAPRDTTIGIIPFYQGLTLTGSVSLGNLAPFMKKLLGNDNPKAYVNIVADLQNGIRAQGALPEIDILGLGIWKLSGDGLPGTNIKGPAVSLMLTLEEQSLYLSGTIKNLLQSSEAEVHIDKTGFSIEYTEKILDGVFEFDVIGESVTDKNGNLQDVIFEGKMSQKDGDELSGIGNIIGSVMTVINPFEIQEISLRFSANDLGNGKLPKFKFDVNAFGIDLDPITIQFDVKQPQQMFIDVASSIASNIAALVTKGLLKVGEAIYGLGEDLVNNIARDISENVTSLGNNIMSGNIEGMLEDVGDIVIAGPKQVGLMIGNLAEGAFNAVSSFTTDVAGKVADLAVQAADKIAGFGRSVTDFLGITTEEPGPDPVEVAALTKAGFLAQKASELIDAVVKNDTKTVKKLVDEANTSTDANVVTIHTTGPAKFKQNTPPQKAVIVMSDPVGDSYGPDILHKAPGKRVALGYNTPLHLAVAANNTTAITELLKSKALTYDFIMGTSNKHGKNAFDMAIDKNNIQIFKAFFEAKGADGAYKFNPEPNAEPFRKIYHLALREYDQALIQLLRKYPSFDFNAQSLDNKVNAFDYCITTSGTLAVRRQCDETLAYLWKSNIIDMNKYWGRDETNPIYYLYCLSSLPTQTVDTIMSSQNIKSQLIQAESVTLQGSVNMKNGQISYSLQKIVTDNKSYGPQSFYGANLYRAAKKALDDCSSLVKDKDTSRQEKFLDTVIKKFIGLQAPDGKAIRLPLSELLYYTIREKKSSLVDIVARALKGDADAIRSVQNYGYPKTDTRQALSFRAIDIMKDQPLGTTQQAALVQDKKDALALTQREIKSTDVTLNYNTYIWLKSRQANSVLWVSPFSRTTDISGNSDSASNKDHYMMYAKFAESMYNWPRCESAQIILRNKANPEKTGPINFGDEIEIYVVSTFDTVIKSALKAPYSSLLPATYTPWESHLNKRFDPRDASVARKWFVSPTSRSNKDATDTTYGEVFVGRTNNPTIQSDTSTFTLKKVNYQIDGSVNEEMTGPILIDDHVTLYVKSRGDSANTPFGPKNRIWVMASTDVIQELVVGQNTNHGQTFAFELYHATTPASGLPPTNGTIKSIDSVKLANAYDLKTQDFVGYLKNGCFIADTPNLVSYAYGIATKNTSMAQTNRIGQALEANNVLHCIATLTDGKIVKIAIQNLGNNAPNFVWDGSIDSRVTVVPPATTTTTAKPSSIVDVLSAKIADTYDVTNVIKDLLKDGAISGGPVNIAEYAIKFLESYDLALVNNNPILNIIVMRIDGLIVQKRFSKYSDDGKNLNWNATTYDSVTSAPTTTTTTAFMSSITAYQVLNASVNTPFTIPGDKPYIVDGWLYIPLCADSYGYSMYQVPTETITVTLTNGTTQTISLSPDTAYAIDGSSKKDSQLNGSLSYYFIPNGIKAYLRIGVSLFGGIDYRIRAQSNIPTAPTVATTTTTTTTTTAPPTTTTTTAPPTTTTTTTVPQVRIASVVSAKLLDAYDVTGYAQSLLSNGIISGTAIVNAAYSIAFNNAMDNGMSRDAIKMKNAISNGQGTLQIQVLLTNGKAVQKQFGQSTGWSSWDGSEYDSEFVYVPPTTTTTTAPTTTTTTAVRQLTGFTASVPTDEWRFIDKVLYLPLTVRSSGFYQVPACTITFNAHDGSTINTSLAERDSYTFDEVVRRQATSSYVVYSTTDKSRMFMQIAMNETGSLEYKIVPQAGHPVLEKFTKKIVSYTATISTDGWRFVDNVLYIPLTPLTGDLINAYQIPACTITLKVNASPDASITLDPKGTYTPWRIDRTQVNGAPIYYEQASKSKLFMKISVDVLGTVIQTIAAEMNVPAQPTTTTTTVAPTTTTTTAAPTTTTAPQNLVQYNTIIEMSSVGFSKKLWTFAGSKMENVYDILVGAPAGDNRINNGPQYFMIRASGNPTKTGPVKFGDAVEILTLSTKNSGGWGGSHLANFPNGERRWRAHTTSYWGTNWWQIFSFTGVTPFVFKPADGSESTAVIEKNAQIRIVCTTNNKNVWVFEGSAWGNNYYSLLIGDTFTPNRSLSSAGIFTINDPTNKSDAVYNELQTQLK